MRKKKSGHKIGVCEKCDTTFYIHSHHIFPKANFGTDGVTIDLCPNCHTHCHVYLSENVKDKNNVKEVEAAWIKWFTEINPVVKILIGIVAVSSLAYFIQ